MSASNEREAIQAILTDATKLTQNLEKLKDICEASGINVDESFAISFIEDDPGEALAKLFKNLSGLPVVKIAAKMAGKKYGITF